LQGQGAIARGAVDAEVGHQHDPGALAGGAGLLIGGVRVVVSTRVVAIAVVAVGVGLGVGVGVVCDVVGGRVVGAIVLGGRDLLPAAVGGLGAGRRGGGLRLAAVGAARGQ